MHNPDELVIEQLEPCPFCGGAAMLFLGYRDHWRVECTRCSATRQEWFARDGSKAKAAAAWNTRLRTAPVDQVETVELHFENGLHWVWIVWAMKPGDLQVAAICSDEATAARYETALVEVYPGCRLAKERAPLDHAFGAADLRSVVMRTARRASIGQTR